MKSRGVELQNAIPSSPSQVGFSSPIQAKLMENPVLFMLRDTNNRQTVGELQNER